MRLLAWCRCVTAALALLAALTLRAPLRAQTTDASIVGTVRSSDGGVLPGAVVTVRNAATGFELRMRAAADGHFAFLQLPLGGPYTARATSPNHADAAGTGYDLRLWARVGVPLGLRR